MCLGGGDCDPGESHENNVILFGRAEGRRERVVLDTLPYSSYRVKHTAVFYRNDSTHLDFIDYVLTPFFVPLSLLQWCRWHYPLNCKHPSPSSAWSSDHTVEPTVMYGPWTSCSSSLCFLALIHMLLSSPST